MEAGEKGKKREWLSSAKACLAILLAQKRQGCSQIV